MRDCREVGGRVTTEQRSRSYQLLPPGEWGLGSWGCIGCGPNGSSSTEHRVFGFFEVVDRWEQWAEPAAGTTAPGH